MTFRKPKLFMCFGLDPKKKKITDPRAAQLHYTKKWLDTDTEETLRFGCYSIHTLYVSTRLLSHFTTCYSIPGGVAFAV